MKERERKKKFRRMREEVFADSDLSYLTNKKHN